MKTFNKLCTVPRLLAAVVLVLGGLANAQVLPPDLTVCNGVDKCEAPNSVCDASGFTVTLKNYTPAPEGTTGSASYTYTVCAPANDGTCSIGGAPCQDNSDCWANRCQTGGPHADTCSQDDTTACTTDKDCNTANLCTGGTSTCRVDKFQDLSHVDVLFPELGGTCLSSSTLVSGSCTNGEFKLGDSSCFDPGTSNSFVAKCDNTTITAGQCLDMTLTIPGELNKPGLGAAVVVDKESTSCTTSCISGPSCDACDEGGEEHNQCLTRTLGFWGTHPWITNNYATESDPVTVCGKPLDCSGTDDSKSNPSCQVGTCDSVMEGLGSNPGVELSTNQPYVAMVKQLTAAKLSLKATAALFEGATCSDWRYGDKTIQQWIGICEGLCGASKSAISNSGCIEALTAFNSDQDVGFSQTPSPFDRPPVDDHGNISGADPSGFTAAHGNTNPPGKWVIGKQTTGLTGHDCR